MRTTVAQALQDYAMERLQFLKGADQEARRINSYLRAVGLATLKLTELSKPAVGCQDTEDGEAKGRRKQYFEVSLESPQSGRKVARGLGKHRKAQAKETAAADAQRELVARMPVADVQTFHVQKLIEEMRKVREPATVHLERSVLRRLFNHASDSWHWSEPRKNPAVGLTMPKVDNARDRVMSLDEQQRLDEAITTCRNQLVGPTLTLLRETAMRTSEPPSTHAGAMSTGVPISSSSGTPRTTNGMSRCRRWPFKRCRNSHSSILPSRMHASSR
jgi:hypothetical protein